MKHFPRHISLFQYFSSISKVNKHHIQRFSALILSEKPPKTDENPFSNSTNDSITKQNLFIESHVFILRFIIYISWIINSIEVFCLSRLTEKIDLPLNFYQPIKFIIAGLYRVIEHFVRGYDNWKKCI